MYRLYTQTGPPFNGPVPISAYRQGNDPDNPTAEKSRLGTPQAGPARCIPF